MVLNQYKFDAGFLCSWSRCSLNDRLGKLKLTDEGELRDQIVIENFFSKKIPLCGVLGGGYNKEFKISRTAFFIT